MEGGREGGRGTVTVLQWAQLLFWGTTAASGRSPPNRGRTGPDFVVLSDDPESNLFSHPSRIRPGPGPRATGACTGPVAVAGPLRQACQAQGLAGPAVPGWSPGPCWWGRGRWRAGNARARGGCLPRPCQTSANFGQEAEEYEILRTAKFAGRPRLNCFMGVTDSERGEPWNRGRGSPSDRGNFPSRSFQSPLPCRARPPRRYWVSSVSRTCWRKL